MDLDRREAQPVDEPVPEPVPDPIPGSIEDPEAALEHERGPLGNPDRLLLASAVVLFASAFLPWFEADGFTRSGWENFLSLLGILLGLTTAAVAAIEHYTDTPMPMMSVTTGEALFRAALATVGLITLQLLVGDSLGPRDLGAQAGAYVGFVATIGLAGGGWLRRQEDAVYD